MNGGCNAFAQGNKLPTLTDHNEHFQYSDHSLGTPGAFPYCLKQEVDYA